jgi:DNA-binding NarL/FixJ family response regulator
LAALGEYDDARQTAEEQLRIARRWGTAGPVAAALRSLAAAEQGTARVDLLTQARSVLEGSRDALERMHVLLELGTALRHLRRQSESREPLLEALELAERGGAALVAERARAELAATGIKRRKRTFLAGIEALTPSERRVATMAAEGMSNPEIAQSLFVTRKTVEKHLANAYAKLEIGSRGELPQALG